MEEDETGQIVPLSLFLSKISDIDIFYLAYLEGAQHHFLWFVMPPTTFCFSTQSNGQNAWIFMALFFDF